MAEPSQKPEASKLSDVINYTPDEYFSADEVSLIQGLLKDKRVMRVLRKVLIPTICDPDLPLEQFGNDIFLSGRNYAQIPEAELKSVILAREDAVRIVAGGLIRLSVIANSPVNDTVEEAYKRSKDSAQ